MRETDNQARLRAWKYSGKKEKHEKQDGQKGEAEELKLPQ